MAALSCQSCSTATLSASSFPGLFLAPDPEGSASLLRRNWPHSGSEHRPSSLCSKRSKSGRFFVCFLINTYVRGDFYVIILRHWRREWQPTPAFLPAERGHQESETMARPHHSSKMTKARRLLPELKPTQLYLRAPAHQMALKASEGPGFNPWGGKIPWRRAWQPTPVFLPRESPCTEEPDGLQSTGSQFIHSPLNGQ